MDLENSNCIPFTRNDKYRIVIYGAGTLGQRFYKSFKNIWNNIDIVAIADSYKKSTGWAENVISPEQVLVLFRDKIIDGVFIAIEKGSEAVHNFLIKNNVPIYTFPQYNLVKADDVCSFKQEMTMYNTCFYKLSNWYVRIESSTFRSWMFNEDENIVLRENCNYRETPMPVHPLWVNDGEKAIRHDGEVCVLCNEYTFNYWHFTFEILDKLVVLENQGYKGSYILPDIGFVRELTELVGIDTKRIIWINEKTDGTIYKIKNLIVFEPFFGFEFRTIEALCQWADSIAKKLTDGIDYPKRIFVKRNGTRKLLNIEPILDKYDFYTMDPDAISVREQIKYFRSADIVISPHGGNCANIIYMKNSSFFIETFGNNYRNFCNKPAICTKKIKYRMIVEDYASRFGAEFWQDDYSVDEDILGHLLDEITENQRMVL